MRIVGEIPHPSLKITIFSHDNKYAVKFESGLHELVYQFRSGDYIQSPVDLQSIVDEAFIADTRNLLARMRQQQSAAIERWLQSENEEEFETII